MKRATRSVVLACIALVVVVFGVVVLLRPVGRGFDAKIWNQREKNWGHAAAEMADRLVAQSTLQDMPRSEVIRMLGAPPKASYFKDWDSVYWLGTERGYMSIDSEWLVIRYGPDQRVVDYRIVRD